jgi:hypothetical protein
MKPKKYFPAWEKYLNQKEMEYWKIDIERYVKYCSWASKKDASEKFREIAKKMMETVEEKYPSQKKVLQNIRKEYNLEE